MSDRAQEHCQGGALFERGEMKDVMLDLETFGNGKHAAIVQIGACYFNRATGEIGETFTVNIDARSSVESGAELDADTVYWWLSQPKEAIACVTADPQVKIVDAMNSLNDFLEKAACIWSHATFDFVILTETYRRLKIKTKFHYRTCRDIRTLIDLAQIDHKNPTLVRGGTHHNALDDCIFQVKYCHMAFSKLGSNSPTEHKL